MSETAITSPDPDSTGSSIRSPAEEIVVVSNRQPYRHRREAGEITVDQPTGGLVAGLDPMMRRLDETWVAWGDGDADRVVSDTDGTVRVPPDDPSYTLARVWLTQTEVDDYYYGYSNRALWPLCHSDLARASFKDDEWDAYRSVNQRFADVVEAQVEDDGLVWFHDYHFALAPRFASETTDATVMQFWHIPWPDPEIFQACPHAETLLYGLLGNDSLSFHVPRYVENFLESVAEILDDATVDPANKLIRYQGETTYVDALPLGIDAEATRVASRRSDETDWLSFCREQNIDPDRSVVTGVDRLDYTKGIPERLDALEHLWETRPEWRGEFTYVQKASESRSKIDAYRKLQSRVEDRIAQINSRFGTNGWTPVAYTTEYLTREQLCGLYRRSDVALVTPLRDGMNLVSKEYVAAQVDEAGVLVLSRNAGAHEALGDLTLTVDPEDTSAHAETIETALNMPRWERRVRMDDLRERVHENDLATWIADQLRSTHRVSGSPAPEVTA